MRIEVARACSGVNYLVAVLALGLPLAYLYLRSWWRRGVLIASALLIAAAANSLRVALIGVLVYYDLGAPLHGPAHVLHGLFVSASATSRCSSACGCSARASSAPRRTPRLARPDTSPLTRCHDRRWR